MKFDEWTRASPMLVDNGAVFWMNPPSAPPGNAVVGQITMASGTSFQASLNFQGQSTGELADWQATAVVFTNDPDALVAPAPTPSAVPAADPSPAPAPAASDPAFTDCEQVPQAGSSWTVSPILEVVACGGIAGHTTWRFSIELQNAASNVYAIFGHQESPLRMPAAWQEDAASFGVNVGGVMPVLLQHNPDALFDSWLTVGPVSGSTTSLGSIGFEWASWNPECELLEDNGAVFWSALLHRLPKTRISS